ncbi:RraA family protein [Brevibacillus sp. B_LB10_24]|uniref:RraA family protein n=1 Tax=Brevibacillus sp. B_LB10_24 TaxID=3380645 RepID=UPI0038BD329E
MKETIGTDELLARFAKIYTGAISDSLDQLGYKNQVLPKELKGLTPDANLYGTALTVRGEATHSEDPEVVFVPMLKILGDVKKNDVVITQPHDDTCSHLGELSAAAIKARGGAGAVIYGGVRDVDNIHKLGLPVFHLYTTPADILGRWCLKEYKVPIRIKNVAIYPVDIVAGEIFRNKQAISLVVKCPGTSRRLDRCRDAPGRPAASTLLRSCSYRCCLY